MNTSPTMLAIVTDAFGGRGGIAQYNRDFLGALIETGAVSSITVLPRLAPDLPEPPEKIEQTSARPGRIAYSVAALRIALLRRVDVVFCGHLFMAPLARLIARLKAIKASARGLGRGRSRLVCLAPYACGRIVLGLERTRESTRGAGHSEGRVHAGRRLDTARCPGT